MTESIILLKSRSSLISLYERMIEAQTKLILTFLAWATFPSSIFFPPSPLVTAAKETLWSLIMEDIWLSGII